MSADGRGVPVRELLRQTVRTAVLAVLLALTPQVALPAEPRAAARTTVSAVAVTAATLGYGTVGTLAVAVGGQQLPAAGTSLPAAGTSLAAAEADAVRAAACAPTTASPTVRSPPPR